MQARKLTIENLRVKYGRKAVIPSLSLKEDLQSGSITALLGPNGSGKSTFLRAVAGLIPSEGRVLYGGELLSNMPAGLRTRRAAYVPQALPPAVHLQAVEAVMVARRAGDGHSDAAAALEESMEALERLGVAHLAASFLDELSGGQRQLVGLAQAFVRRPALLLLDEPLSALDLRHQVQVMKTLEEETRRRDIAAIIVVHDLNMALRHADQALFLKEGELRAQGKAAEITTPEILAQIYGVTARVERLSDGQPCIFVEGACPEGNCCGSAVL